MFCNMPPEHKGKDYVYRFDSRRMCDWWHIDTCFIDRDQGNGPNDGILGPDETGERREDGSWNDQWEDPCQAKGKA